MDQYESALDEFNKHGFAVVQLYNDQEIKVISDFAVSLVYNLLKPWVSVPLERLELERYHIWSQDISDEHRNAFGSKNRYLYPEPFVRTTILNENTKKWLNKLGLAKHKVWDDGWGDIGFRLIRPGYNDGYPLCCKNWGKANGVTSFWIPVIGYSSKETLLLARGSHLKDHPKKFVEGKFFANEPRYCGNLDDLDLLRPDLESGQVICYHGATLHSEDVEASDITRLNLEIRFLPS